MVAQRARLADELRAIARCGRGRLPATQIAALAGVTRCAVHQARHIEPRDRILYAGLALRDTEALHRRLSAHRACRAHAGAERARLAEDLRGLTEIALLAGIHRADIARLAGVSRQSIAGVERPNALAPSDSWRQLAKRG